MLTRQELDAIRERCEKATPGPELVRYEHGGGRSYIQTGDWESLHGKRDRKLVADYYNEEDREFYHSARADIPALLAHIEELEAKLKNRWGTDMLTDEEMGGIKSRWRLQRSQERTLIEAQNDIDDLLDSLHETKKRIDELESHVIRWIPISDSHPLDLQHALICGSTGAIRSAVWHDYVTGGERPAGFSPEDDWYVRILGVTHWAELPAPPKEESC